VTVRPQILDSRNYLDWMSDFDSKLKIKHLAGSLSAIAVARDKLVDHILEVADREIDGTPNCKCLEFFAKSNVIM
jgi:hypothetical protein